MDSIFGIQIQYLLIGIILILAALLVYLLVVIRAYRKRQITQEGNTAASDAETSDAADKSQSEDTTKIVASTRYVELRMSFARAMKRLKANIPGRNYRYELPWFIMAGEAESGKTTVLGGAKLSLPLGPPDKEERGRQQQCKWWFFDKGVVLDIAGDYVMRMDGKTADDKGWQRVIRLLQKYRPERPIDGAILTIPCTDLIPSQLGDEWRAKTEDKAILLYNKLWEAHRTLGMCFPLYILVTKCDQVMGFGSFCKEIPERLRDDIFGWSNPYALGTAYTTDWVAEAFQNIHEHLYLTQTEVIADGIQVQDKDAFFLFPAEFQSMSEPLRIFLDSFFKQSVYHESFFFRGLYFCGDSQTGAMPSIASADDMASDDSSVPSTDSPAPPVSSIETEATPKAPFFLKRLFEQKIFPEYGLARPITRTFLSKNRTVVITQAVLLIFVLVAGVGLGVNYYKLKTALGGKYVAVLENIKENLPDEKQTDINQRVSTDNRNEVYKEFNDDQMTELLESIRRIPDLTKYFIPLSWWDSGIRTQFNEAMRIGIGEVLKQARHKLIANINTVENQDPVDPNEAINLLKTVESFNNLSFRVAFDDPESQILHALQNEKITTTGELLEAAKSRDANSLPLDKLYLIKREGAGWRIGKKYTIDDERGMLKIYGPIPKKAKQKKEERAQKLNIVFRELQWTVDFGEDQNEYFKTEQLARTDVPLPRVKLDKYKGLVDRVQDALRRNPDLKELERIVESEGEDQDLPNLQEAITKAEAALNEYQVFFQLEAVKNSGELEKISETYERILTTENKGLVLSPDMKTLKQILAPYSSVFGQSTQSEMSLPKLIEELSANEGNLLIWNTALLDEAEKLSKAQLDKLSEVARTMFRNAQKKSLTHLIVQAAEITPMGPEVEECLDVGMQSFVKSQAFLSEPTLTDLCVGCSELFVAQALNLLNVTDQLLEQARPYPVGHFSKWNGKKLISSRMFGVSDKSGMKQYLNFHRGRVEALADVYAKPVVTFLDERKSTNSGLLTNLQLSKWSEILSDLDEYKNKTPGNAVLVLETFMLAEMDDIDLENFKDKIPTASRNEESTFFPQKLNDLRAAIYNRCQELVAEKDADRPIETVVAKPEDEQSVYEAVFLTDAFLKRLSSNQPTELRTTLPRGPHLMWDTARLKEAVELYDQYKQFMSERLQTLVGQAEKRLSLDWENIVQNRARDGLERRMVVLINQAARIADPPPKGFARRSWEASLHEEAQSFEAAKEPLGRLLSIFQEMGFTELHDNLSDLLIAQASNLLVAVDQLFETEELYTVGGLPWDKWNGRVPISSAVFGFPDAAAMNGYLDFQRERTKALATGHAQPVVTFLNSKKTNNQELFKTRLKWDDILSHLRQYESKAPNNPVAALENFMRSEMDEINLTNFSQKIMPKDRATRSDFFPQRLNDLRRTIYERCQEVTAKEAIPGYRQLEEFFNSRLAGKFPFSEDNANSEISVEANPADIRNFYRRFDRDAAVVKIGLKANENAVRALAFVEKMERAREFFQSFLEAEQADSPPIFDFEVEFNVNTNAEIGGTQIYGWTLKVGKEKMNDKDKADARRGRWQFGDEIKVYFLIVPKGEGGRATVPGGIDYNFPNRWSLFSLLSRHVSAPADFDRLRDLKPHTLKFIAGSTVGFMRVTVISPDTKEPLVLPDFPSAAPSLNQ